eukprot:7379847-Prymnesium_polylepis.1
MPEDDDGDAQTADGWQRNDAVRMGQRAKDSILFTSEPNLKLPHDSSLYQYALHFLPLDEIDALAARMTDEGIKKFKAGQRKYSEWHVSRERVLKWMGAWMYMLAFPIEGERRLYWAGFEGGFGPTHSLEKFGVTESRFQMMQACFVLPTYGRPGDKHNAVRR